MYAQTLAAPSLWKKKTLYMRGAAVNPCFVGEHIVSAIGSESWSYLLVVEGFFKLGDSCDRFSLNKLGHLIGIR